MTEIGGSHAQRDLFGQILLDAHLKLGNWAHRRTDARNAPHLGSRRRAAQPRPRAGPLAPRRRMNPGPRNLITDVAGLRVGNAEDHRDQDRHHRAGRRQAVPRLGRRHGRLARLARDRPAGARQAGRRRRCARAVGRLGLRPRCRLRRQRWRCARMGRGFVVRRRHHPDRARRHPLRPAQRRRQGLGRQPLPRARRRGARPPRPRLRARHGRARRRRDHGRPQGRPRLGLARAAERPHRRRAGRRQPDRRASPSATARISGPRRSRSTASSAASALSGRRAVRRSRPAPSATMLERRSPTPPSPSSRPTPT